MRFSGVFEGKVALARVSAKGSGLRLRGAMDGGRGFGKPKLKLCTRGNKTATPKTERTLRRRESIFSMSAGWGWDRKAE